jgi:phenylalanyl-tRNA synthetase beta chain
MKVSLNWLKEFTDINLPTEELVEKIGAQLGAIEQVISLGPKYQGIIIARVVTCEQHPNADKLHVCKIDDSHAVADVERDENDLIQVVCGAPNVAADQLVAWLPPGTTVPSSYGNEPFVLEVREIRGQKSNGMLASMRELALGDNHEGIAVLSSDEAKPGDDFATIFKFNDTIIDIENKMFTHRPDLFGQLGVAREIAGITGHAFSSPEWYVHPGDEVLTQDGTNLALSVDNQLPDLAPRFMAIAMEINRSNGASPMWLQAYLSRVGIRPISLLVDISNYMMMVTAQPLHIYDYDKLNGSAINNQAQLIVRYPKKGESLELLGGKTIIPRSRAIMIATDQQLVGLGGIMGGASAEVDEHTKKIVVECATFDMYSIRRSVMEHGLFTDAATRYTKGQSPLQNRSVLGQTVTMLRQLAEAKVCSPLIDEGSYSQRGASESLYAPIVVASYFINSRLGYKLSQTDMTTTLTNVELSVKEELSDMMQISAPFWRTDIEIAEDVVEEVGRLHGYSNLPHGLPKRDLSPAIDNPLLKTKDRIRQILSRAGANEVLTYSFVHGDLLRKVGQDPDNGFELTNALSPELQYFRQSLLPSLLEKVHPNLKAGYSDFCLFEINQTHTKSSVSKKTSLPLEHFRCSFVYAADDKSSLLNYYGAPFYQAKKYLLELMAELGISVSFEPIQHQSDGQPSNPVTSVFAEGRACDIKSLDGITLGVVGEFSSPVRSSLKLPKFIAGFELDVKKLMKLSSSHSDYVELSRFPKVTQDICLRIPLSVNFETLSSYISVHLANNHADMSFSVEPIDIFQKPDDSEHKQITFRVSVGTNNRTLTDTEVNGLLDKLASEAKNDLSAERI